MAMVAMEAMEAKVDKIVLVDVVVAQDKTEDTAKRGWKVEVQ